MWAFLLLLLLAPTTAAQETTGDWTPVAADFSFSSRIRSADLSRDGRRVAFRYLDDSLDYAVAVYAEDDNDSNGTGQWTRLGDVLAEIRAGDLTVRRMRLSGDGKHLLVSAHMQDPADDRRLVGTLLVYRYNDTDMSWTQLGNGITLPTEDMAPSMDDMFGVGTEAANIATFPSGLNMDISHDGSRIVVSFSPYSLLYSSRDFLGLGRVWIFDFDETNNQWRKIAMFGSLGNENDALFGWLPQISGDGTTVTVGRGQVDENQQIPRTYQVFSQINSVWETWPLDTFPTYVDSTALSYTGNVVAFGSFCRWTDTFLYDVCVGQAPVVVVAEYDAKQDDWVQKGPAITWDDIPFNVTEYGRVFLSDDGHRLAVGAGGRLGPAGFSPDHPYHGVIRTYTFDEESGLWAQDGSFSFSGEKSADGKRAMGELHGFSADGSRILVGDTVYTVYERPVQSKSPTEAPTETPTETPDETSSSTMASYPIIFYLVSIRIMLFLWQ